MKRKVVLFIVAQILLVGVFFLSLNSFLCPDLITLFGGDSTVEIIGSNRASNKLQLSPEYPCAFAGKKITWNIAAEDVQTIVIEPKKGQPDVFEGNPPAGNRQRPAVGHLKGRRTRIEYQYSIRWEDNDRKPHTHDPKIAIRPGFRVFEFLIYILLYALLAGIISYMTFRKQMPSETRPT